MLIIKTSGLCRQKKGGGSLEQNRKVRCGFESQAERFSAIPRYPTLLDIESGTEQLCRPGTV